jgi:DnaK suppressor protein
MSKTKIDRAPHTNGASRPANHGDRLQAARREVLRDLGLQLDQVATKDRVAEDDLALVNHDQFVSGKLNKLDYDRLRLINEALDRMTAGDYGTCQRCEEPIPPRRLEVIPWAKYCVHCQEKVSMREDVDVQELAQSAW